MKIKLPLILAIIVIIFVNCNNIKKEPEEKDIVGLWIGKGGSVLRLKKDGTFIGTDLPAEVFMNQDTFKGKTFDFNGLWKIKYDETAGGQYPWYILLDSKNTTLTDSNFYFGSYVIVSGSGLMENNPPWKYLFMWEEEEGGLRYIFERLQ